MPEHGELVGVAGALRLVRVREADEVEDEGVDDLRAISAGGATLGLERRAHLVRERVLFVHQDTDEERVGPWDSSERLIGR